MEERRTWEVRRNSSLLVESRSVSGIFYTNIQKKNEKVYMAISAKSFNKSRSNTRAAPCRRIDPPSLRSCPRFWQPTETPSLGLGRQVRQSTFWLLSQSRPSSTGQSPLRYTRLVFSRPIRRIDILETRSAKADQSNRNEERL